MRRQREGFKLDIIRDERLPFVGSAIWKNCGPLPGKLILFHVAWEGEGTSQKLPEQPTSGNGRRRVLSTQFPVSVKALLLALSLDLYKHPKVGLRK